MEEKLKADKKVIYEKNAVKKEAARKALIKSVPIMFSYLFVSMAYGMMMHNAGFNFIYSLFISMTIYTGAFQFILITFLSSGASLLTIFAAAFFMNSRQFFYSLTFLEDFKKMGKRKLYMIHTMTDETYAINTTIKEKGEERKDIMFFTALFSRCYWMAGALIGGILGQLIPFKLEGIDFCMTALFIIIFIDQWENASSHIPAFAGIIPAVIFLFILGPSSFMLPSLIAAAGILILFSDKISSEEKGEIKNE